MRFARPLALTAQVWYPEGRQTVEEALAASDVDTRTARDLGYTSLPVSEDVAPPDMAVRAARTALDRAGRSADDVSLLAHASVHHQGHDAWSAPHYIANELGARAAVPVGLLQQCNGGAIGIELAADRLARDPSGAVLVTTADRFLMPSWHRWLTDYGMAAGDAGTAVLVERGDGAAADLLLHAITTRAAPELEVMHRGDDGLNGGPLEHSPMIDVRRPKRAFIRSHGAETFTKIAHERIEDVVAACQAEAGLARGDRRLRFAVLPRLGRKAMDEAYRPPLERAADTEIVDLGRASGHVGAGDLNASLAEIAADGLLAPGEYALVLNGGGGFTFTAVVVSRTER
ncbi:ketoacyl-ACP synthase III family protein [Nocardiopsis sp. FIRDI 009]|uniref:ketoacyl-ACP synthase III family protein n=1 Tax=Nocardiopsis sp. FIRDI 009 TaxID=714197 RepID=UPI000E2778A5|nr:ketoacyl-ACP synthase III family protein [Nocardiopsis sp. FIRDI 009]